MATRFNALPVWEQNRQLAAIAAGGWCGDCFVGAVIGPALLERITKAATGAGVAEGLGRPLLVNADFSGVHFTGDAAFERFEFRGGLHARPLTVSGEDQPVIIDGRLHLGGAKIDGNANLRGATIDGNANLVGATIGGAANLVGAKIDGNANLVGATIDGNAHLARAKIGGNAHLRGATIGGNANLRGAKIGGNAHLRGATIGGDANLVRVTVGGDANLVGATIDGNANLTGAKIGGAAYLGGAKIGGDARLSRATIGGNANLAGAKIGADANLAKATIGGDATLARMTIGGDANLAGATIGGAANLARAKIGGNATLAGAKIGGDANLARAKIGGDANLGGATITVDLLFVETRIGGGLTFDCAVSRVVDARGLSVEGAAPDQRVPNGSKLVLDRARFAKEVRWTLTLGDESWSTEGLRLVEGGQIIVDGVDLDLSGATVLGPLEITAAEWSGAAGTSSPLSVKRMDLSAPVTVASGTSSLLSVERMDLSAPVTVASGIDVRKCEFGGTPNLDQLRFAGTDQFDTHWGRQVIRAERDFRVKGAGEARGIAWVGRQLRTRCLAPGGGDEGEARGIAAVYRQLRTSLEATKDYAGASDFYYGEMEMRRSAAWHSGGWRAFVDWVVIWMYWLISGYGLGAWRAFATFTVVVALATVLFQFNDFSPGAAELGYVDTVVYTLKSSISLWRPPADTELTLGENLVQITLRILAPALFALGVFALRARIRR